MLHSTPTPAVTTLVEIDDLRDMLSNDSDFGPAHYAVLQKATNKQQAMAFRQLVDELRRNVDGNGQASESVYAKLGSSLYLLGQHQAAHTTIFLEQPATRSRRLHLDSSVSR